METSIFPKLTVKRYNPLFTIVLSYLIVIVIGTILLMHPYSSSSNEWTNPLDAAFTATSATTVTGLVVVDTATHWSFFGQLIILLLIHLGGLGYMTIIASIIILVKRRGMTESLILGESLNTYSFKGIFSLAKSMFMVVILLEALGAMSLFVSWAPSIGIKRGLWFGVFHAVSAFNNAGFDLMGGYASLMQYVNNPVVNITIMGLIVTGGLGFFVFLEFANWLTGKGKLSLHTKLVLTTTCLLILLGAALIFILESQNPETLGSLQFTTRVWGAMFTSVAARTAGFNTLPIDKLTDASLVVIIILMFIGASPGGTGGGIKTTTIAVIFFTLFSYLKGGKETYAGSRTLEDSTVKKAHAITIIAVCFITIFTLGIMFTGARFLPALFEVTSAFGTVGLTTGIARTAAAKVILIVAMFIGRIGVLSMVLLFTRASATHIHLPKEHISIG